MTGDLRMNHLNKIDTCDLQHLPKLSDKVPYEILLKDVITALLSIPSESITETNNLVYTTTMVFLDLLGYEFKPIKQKANHRTTKLVEDVDCCSLFCGLVLLLKS